MITGTTESTAKVLAQNVRQLMNAGVIDEVIFAVQNGEIFHLSGSASIAKLAAGRTTVQKALTNLIKCWSEYLHKQNNDSFALQLSSIKEAIFLVEREATQTEVVWSGPKVDGSYLRATRQVVQDIIASSKTELLVVGYWLAGKEDSEGIINDIVEQIAQAVTRNVKVTLVLDKGEKGYGKNNRETLLSLWPKDLPLPLLLTWKIPSNDQHLKLHAKVLVSDRRDALVTSANLTMYALDRNIEMGVRMQGDPSKIMAQHFEILKTKNILVPYSY
ncbi:DISARM system phospholipase D-like protein DrmC [Desulforhopalus sp. IMCC35007]|uniref:DISARM system phospholipase D-like protein DrmC n=1 Tax=Desulforhopalus sp. IMCC35007 TaxID=2569543 RepID=UPI0010AE24DA|nr:DISARM system phospholipase D-like protein DrmC [Desulforhopalus sp. IMCC35007]TKB08842.1 hypothetical protein FCL48_12505 [Desulforhopalus sp. IMCC35007]